MAFAFRQRKCKLTLHLTDTELALGSWLPFLITKRNLRTQYTEVRSVSFLKSLPGEERGNEGPWQRHHGGIFSQTQLESA